MSFNRVLLRLIQSVTRGVYCLDRVAGKTTTQSISARSQVFAEGLALDLNGILTVFDAVMSETFAVTVNNNRLVLGSAPKLNVLASGAPRSAALGFASRVARSCFSITWGKSTCQSLID